jgi:hypothetical protein
MLLLYWRGKAGFAAPLRQPLMAGPLLWSLVGEAVPAKRRIVQLSDGKTDSNSGTRNSPEQRQKSRHFTETMTPYRFVFTKTR